MLKFKFTIKKLLILGYAISILLLIIVSTIVIKMIDSIEYQENEVKNSILLSKAINDANHLLLKEQFIVMELLESEEKSQLNEWTDLHTSTSKELINSFNQIKRISKNTEWGEVFKTEKQLIHSNTFKVKDYYIKELNPLISKIIYITDQKIILLNSINTSLINQSLLLEKKILGAQLDSKFDNRTIEVAKLLTTLQKDIHFMEKASNETTEGNTFLAKSTIWVIGIVSLLITLFFGKLIVAKLQLVLGEDPEIVAKYVDQIALGKISLSISNAQNKPAIGLLKSVENMSLGLNKAGMFAKEIGKGNLDAELDLLSDEDELGQALLEMKLNLVDAKTNIEAIHRENDARIKLMDELCIVSETDTKGYITYVNDKFCEVAQYSKAELIGQNHNIVRHPDMPKEAFKALWSTIGKGELFRAKVKNKKKTVHLILLMVFLLQ